MGHPVNLAPYRASLADLSPWAEPWDGPLALVDLAEAADREIALPPCPVIGLGDPGHPLADRLDCVVEPPVTAAGLVRQVVAHPQAAAVIVGLLRMLPGLPVEAGLAAESLAYGVLQAGGEHAAWQQQEREARPPPGQVSAQRREDRLDIVLHNPVASAIGREARDQLHEALSLAVLDPTIRQVVLSASGRAFSMGADLAEFGTTRDPAAAHLIRARESVADQHRLERAL